MNESVRLQCLHRNPLFRQCLVSVLAQFPTYHAQELDHTTPDFRNEIHKCSPNVILIDLNLPERLALELTSYARRCHADVNVILLMAVFGDAHNDAFKFVECIEAGARGYVFEESSLEHLRLAIDKVMLGQVFCSPQLVEPMIAQMAALARESGWRRRVEAGALTKREIEILQWIADGMSNKQVAKKLSLSLYTVKNHVHNILEKLQVDNRFEAVRHAVENRWLTVSSSSVPMASASGDR